jgi:hypothetical protein
MFAMGANAWAQGGPPMVTDDPATPGDGHWEVNLGAIGTRTPGHWEIAAPDADINYGWGERVQLKVDVPWLTTRDDGQHWKSDFGDIGLGVKWRFLDQDEAGVSVSTYPQYNRHILESSIRRGITTDGHQVFLPVEVARETGGLSVAAELGRNFVQGGASQWQAGVVAGHACGGEVECMAEVHTTWAAGERQTLLNLGLHWKLSDSVALLAAAGHDFGTRSEAHHDAIVYLGLQLSR